MNLQSYMRIDKSVYQAKIESMSSIDPAWLVRFIAHTRTLVALGMWQDYRLTDVAEQFVQTLNNAPVQLQSKPGRQLPIQRFLKKAVRYNFAAGAIPLKHLLTPVITDLYWQQNPNYDDPNFLETYGFVELIGPDGYATTDKMRMGCFFLRRIRIMRCMIMPQKSCIMFYQGKRDLDIKTGRNGHALQVFTSTTSQTNRIR